MTPTVDTENGLVVITGKRCKSLAVLEIHEALALASSLISAATIAATEVPTDLPPLGLH